MLKMFLGWWLDGLAYKLTLSTIVAVVLSLCWFPGCARGEDPLPQIKLKVEHREAAGLSPYSAAARTVGRHLGYAPLANLPDLQSGSEGFSVALARAGVKLTSVSSREEMFAAVDAGRIVISTARGGSGVGQYPLLVVGLTKSPVRWQSGDGGWHTDYVVTYVDMGDHRWNYQYSWRTFSSSWTGRAEVLTVANTSAITPVSPGAKGAVVFPSNQDIKDGVRRPLDVLRDGTYAPYRHDYYQEYRKKAP